MEDFQTVQKEIEGTEVFQTWKKQYPHAYIVHFFCMDEKEIQVGYYDEKEDCITTFTKAEEITKTEDNEIFRQQKKIAPLVIEEVKITANDAVQKGEALLKQKYPADLVAKKIIVLQTINKQPVYNMTIITATFKMINIRVDAATGNIIEEKMQPIMDFVQTIEKGNKTQKEE